MSNDKLERDLGPRAAEELWEYQKTVELLVSMDEARPTIEPLRDIADIMFPEEK